MRHWIKSFVKNEEAATALEYAVIAGVLVVALIGVFQAFGDDIKALFEGISAKLTPPA